MITFRLLSRCSLTAGAAIVVAALLPVPNASAQRPSVADMQEQIDALTYPYDEPAAQVRTALDLLPTFQEAVVRSFRATGEAPADRSSAGLTALATDTSTSFIVAVNIVNGSIVFTFGNDADASLTGKMLIFTPYESSDMTVVWRCGNEPVSAGVVLLGMNGGNGATYSPSTIPAITHPSPCILKSYADSGAVIRAQVETALDILPTFQEGVVDHYRQTGAVPVNRIEAGLTAAETDTSTNFIAGVEIINGTIIVTFGNEAHPDIQGHTLGFTPYETPDMTVVWRCGWNTNPPGTSLLGTVGGAGVAVYDPGSLAYYLQPRPCITKSYAASDDVIMAQVLEPFDVVETIKSAIETAGVALGSPSQPTPPIDRAEAGLSINATDTLGQYFNRVDVVNGTIIVTYDSSETHAAIRGNTMTWTPYESPDGTIVWRCGSAQPPQNTALMGTAAGVTVAAYNAPIMPLEYLPNNCRY